MQNKSYKKQWKYIKSSGLVSKFYWDSKMGYYDCYCKACSVKGVKVGNNIFNWKSWVGNPDIGFVRKVFYKTKDNTFYYRPFGVNYEDFYEPCKADEYERLVWLSKKEFNKEADRLNIDQKFEEIWEKRLRDSEVNSNGNIIGGAWRNPETGKIKGNNILLSDIDKLITEGYTEKVVTLGWHRTEPKNAIRCPVCEDLYTIFTNYSPVPWYLKLRQKVSNLLFYIKRVYIKTYRRKY